MRISYLWIIILIIIAVSPISACTSKPAAAEKVNPVKLEPIEGSDLKRVILTEKAAERIDLQTVLVQEAVVNGVTRIVVPYAAVLYGLNGETWSYTSQEPLTFVRQPIIVDFIDGDMAILVEGPALGTEVVTVGVAELFGAETGVSK